jgi:hypothetical protein
LLAEYVTIYNAVYRGNWDYFGNRYKAQVMGNLTSDKVGLSIRYDEWPGRTLLVIPLGIGGLSSVDTSTLSDQKVIEEMRREEDQGIPQRREMVNLIERETERVEQQAQTQRESIRQEERQIEQERQQVQEAQQEGKITQEVAQQLEEVLDRREQDLEQRRDIVQRLEEIVEQKTDSAQQMRQDIARDIQNLLSRDVDGVLGIKIERTSPIIMGRLVLYNPADGKEVKKSPLDLVHLRTIVFTAGRILAIAGENRGQGAVRIIELNQASLEMARQGGDDIKSGSLLWVNGNDLYAILIDLAKNQCYLGRFNTNLELQAKSVVRVHPDCSVVILPGRLLTQNENGSALALNPADLTEVK